METRKGELDFSFFWPRILLLRSPTYRQNLLLSVEMPSLLLCPETTEYKRNETLTSILVLIMNIILYISTNFYPVDHSTAFPN
jgi:hypothetical protein